MTMGERIVSQYSKLPGEQYRLSEKRMGRQWQHPPMDNVMRRAARDQQIHLVCRFPLSISREYS